MSHNLTPESRQRVKERLLALSKHQDAPFDTEPKKPKRKKLSDIVRITIDQVTTLDSLRRFLKIAPTDWNGILVTDGSGTTWEKEGGWGAVLIQNGSFVRVPFSGSMSHCTNNIAELMAVLHPIMFLTSNKAGVNTDGYKLHVVSDSEYVVKGLREGNIAWAQGLKQNREIWVALHMARRKGLIITSHHVYRDKIDLNRLAHDLANLSRKSQINIIKELEHDVYQANPHS